MRSIFGRIAVVVLVLASTIIGTTLPAQANTRSNANSYINTRTNLNIVPGSPNYFWANAGTLVWMDCWTRGPRAHGQYKWFKVTVRQQYGYGIVGYVPAPAVGNQWDSSPLCPPW